MRRPLGQHFLINRSVVHRILQILELTPQDSVLEIGPGKGALTGPLATRVGRLLLIEKDPRLAEEVSEKLKDRPSVQVLCDDFLQVPWEKIVSILGEGFKVVSNLPYQTATAILVKLLNHLPPNSIMSLMFQKEVGDRLLAEPHTKDYGSLTVFTQLFAQVKLVQLVSPKSFRPCPQVTSALLKFRMRERSLVSKDELPGFENMVRSGFAHRRKMLRQTLRPYFSGVEASQIELRLERVGASPRARPEELSVNQWVQLFRQAK